MNFEKIQNIKLSLMEVVDEVNMDRKKLEFIVRASISINLEDLEFERSKSTITTISNDMFDTIKSNVKLPSVNYLGIWIKYDGEVFDNSIKLQTLEDIKNYSSEEVNPIYEFIMMTIPEQ